MPFGPDLDVHCLTAQIAEAPEAPGRCALDDCHEQIEDLEGIQIFAGLVIWPAHVAEEGTDLEPISVEEYIEVQRRTPWCQAMGTKTEEGQQGRFKTRRPWTPVPHFSA